MDQFPSVTQTFILNQITGLIDRGCKVEIFSDKRSYDSKVHDDVKTYNLLSNTTHLGGFSEKKIWENKFFRIVQGIGYIFQYIAKHPFPILNALNIFRYGKKAASLYLLFIVVSILKRGQFDIVHCQFGTLGLKAMFYRELGVFSGKLIVSFRGFDVTQYLLNRPGIYDALYQKGDLFLPVSETLKKKLIENGCEKEKIIVHHSGIDCAKFQLKDRWRTNGEPTKVLTIARLTEKKGIAYATEAVARLVSSGRKMNYIVVGEGKLRSNLERLINTLCVENSVRLTGWRNHEEVTLLLNDAHVLLAPSITADDGDQEGIPNAIKEAMAVGLPVVSTWHGGIPELVEDGVSGFLVSERNADELADRLAYLADHPEKWSEMGRRGRDKVLESFDINKLNDILVKIYSNLLVT